MSKKNRRVVLNPIVEEHVEEKNVVETEPIQIDLNLLAEKPVDESAEISSIVLSSAPEEELVVPEEIKEPCVCDKTCVCTEPCVCDETCVCTEEQPIEEKPKKRTIESLSTSELREFRRTGRMPK